MRLSAHSVRKPSVAQSDPIIHTNFFRRALPPQDLLPRNVTQDNENHPRMSNDVNIEQILADTLVFQLNGATPRAPGIPKQEAMTLQAGLLNVFDRRKEGGEAITQDKGVREHVRRSALVLYDLGFDRRDLDTALICDIVFLVLDKRYRALVDLKIAPTVLRKRGHLLDPEQLQKEKEQAERFFEAQRLKSSPARTVFTLVANGVYESSRQACETYMQAYRYAITHAPASANKRSMARQIALQVMMGRFENAEKAISSYAEVYELAKKKFEPHALGKDIIGTIANGVNSGSIPSVEDAHRRFLQLVECGERLCAKHGYEVEHIRNAVRCVLNRSCPKLELALEYLSKYSRPGRGRHVGPKRPAVTLSQFLKQRSANAG